MLVLPPENQIQQIVTSYLLTGLLEGVTTVTVNRRQSWGREVRRYLFQKKINHNFRSRKHCSKERIRNAFIKFHIILREK